MSLLSKIVAAKATSMVVNKLNNMKRTPRPAAAPQYIPAGQVAPVATGTVMDRAKNFYATNPKTVTTAAGAIAMLALAAFAKKRHLM